MKNSLYYLTLCMATFIFMSVSIVKSHWFSIPDYFPKSQLKFDKITPEKIDLGQALFYDMRLSKDNSISCASCHSPYNAFAHTDHDLSHGINDEIGIRNAPALFNLAWQKSFMWDGAINHLDMQALAPLTSPTEMGSDLKKLIVKLQSIDIYPNLFFKAFDDSLITGEFLLKALSAFQMSLISANSKYDRVRQGKEEFTKQEKLGYDIFKKDCNLCHTEPLFTNLSFENNGLLIDTFLNDYGKIRISQKASDSLKFKVPSLRNISYTYPYMHDGRFQSLSEVIKFYFSEKKNPLVSEKIKGITKISSKDKIDLISFLLTLNDSAFVFNPSFHFPKDILMNSEGFK